jgi:hypothetical protein
MVLPWHTKDMGRQDYANPRPIRQAEATTTAKSPAARKRPGLF